MERQLFFVEDSLVNKAELEDMWYFPWPVIDVLIGGKSSIDLPQLQVDSWKDATDFLLSYGYDPEVPEDLRFMHGVIIEALSFIERWLLTVDEWSSGIRPPEEIQLCEDPRHLLLLASSAKPDDRLKRAWACAVLRVMHTIAHIEGVNRYARLESARDQIMGRFQCNIFRDEQRQLWLGDDHHKVQLDRIEWKHRKSRNSIILKLLHKRDNVAETIYDLMGIRIVTVRLCDVMVVVKYLRQFHMVTFPNCYPSRARNNLIDVERFRTQVSALRDMLISGAITAEEFETMVVRVTARPNIVKHSNPHSASSYQAIQLTCRQLIRVRNPQLGWLDKLERELEQSNMSEQGRELAHQLSDFVRHWHTVENQHVIKTFYPFEVQVMDAESHGRILAGDAAHDRYKRSQIRATRKRVLKDVLRHYKR